MFNFWAERSTVMTVRRWARCGSAVDVLRRALLGAALLAWGAGSAAQDLSALESLADDNARISALVVDLSTRQVLAQLNAAARLTPASVTKLYAAAASLERFGPDHRFHTHFVSDGEVVDGVLRGDLVFRGAGDPDFDSKRLWALVERLRQMGVRRVTGDLVIDESLFGAVPCVTVDRCGVTRASRNAYDAPLSAAGVNFSTVEIAFVPGPDTGSPARVSFMPTRLPGFDIVGSVRTVAPGARATSSLRRVTEGGVNRLLVDGQVPVGGPPVRLSRSVPYAANYAAAVVGAILTEAGVDIAGRTRVQSTPLPPGYRSLVSIESTTLAEQLRAMMTYSNNYMADTLTLDVLAYAPDRPVSLTLPQAGERLESLARRANTMAPFAVPQSAASAPLHIDAGSGLSHQTRLSAQDIVSLLAYMYRQSSLFPSLIGSLPVPEHTPSRMLKNGNIDWMTRVLAKTGTLSQPVSVRSLAGYIRLANGNFGAFAVIVNGSDKRRAIPGPESMEAIRTDIELLLARH